MAVNHGPCLTQQPNPNPFPVEYEVARAVFMPPPSAIARGEVSLHCKGLKAIKDRIYWLKDGQPVNEKFVDDPNEALFRSIYTVSFSPETPHKLITIGEPYTNQPSICHSKLTKKTRSLITER